LNSSIHPPCLQAADVETPGDTFDPTYAPSRGAAARTATAPAVGLSRQFGPGFSGELRGRPLALNSVLMRWSRLRGAARAWPPDQVEVVVGAIPRPIAFTLAHSVGWFDTEPSDRKEHCPDRDGGWRGGAPGAAGLTPDHRRDDTSVPSEILELGLQVVSQLHQGIPGKIRPPLAPQERHKLRVPD